MARCSPRAPLRAVRHRRRQCRRRRQRAVPQDELDDLAADARRQPHRRVPDLCRRRCADMLDGGLGAADRRRLHRRPQGLSLRRGLLRRQARRGRPDPRAGASSWRRPASRSTRSAPATPETPMLERIDRQHRRRRPGRSARRGASRRSPRPTRRAGSSSRRRSPPPCCGCAAPARASITGQAIAISGGEAVSARCDRRHPARLARRGCASGSGCSRCRAIDRGRAARAPARRARHDAAALRRDGRALRRAGRA